MRYSKYIYRRGADWSINLFKAESSTARVHTRLRAAPDPEDEGWGIRSRSSTFGTIVDDGNKLIIRLIGDTDQEILLDYHQAEIMKALLLVYGIDDPIDLSVIDGYEPEEEVRRLYERS